MKKLIFYFSLIFIVACEKNDDTNNKKISL
jgi:hypothetical protein